MSGFSAEGDVDKVSVGTEGVRTIERLGLLKDEGDSREDVSMVIKGLEPRSDVGGSCEGGAAGEIDVRMVTGSGVLVTAGASPRDCWISGGVGGRSEGPGRIIGHGSSRTEGPLGFV